MASIARPTLIVLPAGAQARSRTAILAELEDLHARRKILYAELSRAEDEEAGAPRRAPDCDGPIVSLAEAAHAVGWSEQRTRRHIVGHNARSPTDRLGWQAGGLGNGRWCIPLIRWRAYVEHAPAIEA